MPIREDMLCKICGGVLSAVTFTCNWCPLKNPSLDIVKTMWGCWHYDVLGVAQDGFEVNDRSWFNRTHEIELTVEHINAGTPLAFDSAYPRDEQIREALDILPAVKIECEGDDLAVYVKSAKNGRPLGEIHCTSHSSLSPIKAHTTSDQSGVVA